MTTHNAAAIFDAIVRVKKYEKWMQTYQHEILQLAGAGDEWKHSEEVSKTILTVLRSLQDLELYTTMEGENLAVVHNEREFLYQDLLG